MTMFETTEGMIMMTKKVMARLMLAVMTAMSAQAADLGGFTLEEETDGNNGGYPHRYRLWYNKPGGGVIKIDYGYRLPFFDVHNLWVLHLPTVDDSLQGGGGEALAFRLDGFFAGTYMEVDDDPQLVRDLIRRELLAQHSAEDYLEMIESIHAMNGLTPCERRMLDIAEGVGLLALVEDEAEWWDVLDQLIFDITHFQQLINTCDFLTRYPRSQY